MRYLALLFLLCVDPTVSVDRIRSLPVPGYRWQPSRDHTLQDTDWSSIDDELFLDRQSPRAKRVRTNNIRSNIRSNLRSIIDGALISTCSNHRGLLSAAAISIPANHILNCGEPIRRALYFWAKVGPIVGHYRFTQWWLYVKKSPREKRDDVYEQLHDRYCQPSLDIALHMQGLFTKIGQVLSARPDFVPHQYVELFATVQDAVPQWPYEEVEELVRDSLQENQDLEWDEVFESMDATALGSASIGQCHRAVLKAPWDESPGYTGGRTVAVKIMHPGAKDKFNNDFQIFRWLCRLALPGWKPIMTELQKQMMTEFDYRQEAQNLDDVRSNMMSSPYASQVSVPKPLHYLCSKNLLVMELLEGKKLGDAIEDRLGAAFGDSEAGREFLRKKQIALVAGDVSADESRSELIAFGQSMLEQQGKTSLLSRLTMAYRLFSLHNHVQRCVDLLLDVHGHQIFIDRVFNGDCHPGNVLELADGKIGLIDYGQTKRLTKHEGHSIAKVVSELGKSSIDDAKVAEAMRECGFKTKFDKDKVLTMYAKLFFDSDDEAKAEGCVTPQLYLMKLSSMDPLITVPDAAIFTARTSYMFRGMGAMAGDQVRTSKYWKKHADESLKEVI